MHPDSHQPWSGRNVLVTGACGFIGRWLCEKLRQSGATVTGVDRFIPAVASPDQPLQYVNRDVCDLDGMIAIINQRYIDTVIHLAATNINTGTGISPYDVYEVNLRGTYTLLEACRRAAKPPGFILSSSREVDDCMAMDTTRRFHPYMTSKASAELCVSAFSDSFGLACAIVRLDNIYGGGDTNWRRLIPGTIRSVLANESPVIRSDGLLDRDFVYVEDAVNAFLVVAHDLAASRKRGRVFRVGTGVGTNARRIVELVLQSSNRADLGVKILGEKTSERIDSISGPGRELTEMGWCAGISIETGIGRTFQWYKNHQTTEHREGKQIDPGAK